MPKLTTEEKSQRHRQRLLDHARTLQIGTYTRTVVAPLFQQVIRAEAGAKPSGLCVVIVNGELDQVRRGLGQCACITCGKVQRWDSGIKGMHTGHFLASRRNSILFEEENCEPQCSSCNYYRSGAPLAFRYWMLEVRGQEVVERLERLKNEVREFSRDELVDMRISFAARLKAAEQTMKGA